MRGTRSSGRVGRDLSRSSAGPSGGAIEASGSRPEEGSGYSLVPGAPALGSPPDRSDQILAQRSMRQSLSGPMTLHGRGRSAAEDDRDKVHLVSGEEVSTVLLREVSGAKRSFWTTVYVYDHDELTDLLRAKARAPGMDLRLLFDEGQMRTPSCRAQFVKVRLLLDAGVPVRMLKVTGRGRYACLHSKTALVDGKTLLVGSANFSHNSLENNWETLAVVRTKSAPADFKAAFESLWNQGAVVDRERLEDLREQAAGSRPPGHYLE